MVSKVQIEKAFALREEERKLSAAADRLLELGEAVKDERAFGRLQKKAQGLVVKAERVHARAQKIWES